MEKLGFLSVIHILIDMPPWEWPEDASEAIRMVLCDKKCSGEDRVLAAELAGDNAVMDQKMAKHLLSILKSGDESEELRSTVATSFGAGLEYACLMDFEEEDDALPEEMFAEIQKTLRTLFQDTDTPKLIRRRILEGSVRGPMEWHQAAVKEAYETGDREWQITAVFCMGYLEGFEAHVIESLASDNQEVFYEAVRAAGNLALKDAWPVIEELLEQKDIDKWLLIAAIQAAATINPEEASDRLVEFAESDDEDITDAAEDALTTAGMAQGE